LFKVINKERKTLAALLNKKTTISFPGVSKWLIVLSDSIVEFAADEFEQIKKHTFL
jgi:hypothetical protein